MSRSFILSLIIFTNFIIGIFDINRVLSKQPLRNFFSAMAQEKSSDVQTKETIAYIPPKRGAPGGRLGSGARGAGEMSLAVLAPEHHAGLTMQDQPVLYWYLSQTTIQPVEITLTDEESIDPLFQQRLPGPFSAGIHHLALANYDVHLKPQVSYRWSVAVLLDPTDRAKDVIGSGAIVHRPAPATLHAQLARASLPETPGIYAEAGYWYDAFAAISSLIETTSATPTFRQQRSMLLDQVGLQDVATYDRQQ